MYSQSLLDIEIKTLWKNDRITFFVEADLLEHWMSLNGANSRKVIQIFADRGLDANQFYTRCSLIPDDTEAKSLFLFNEILSKPYPSSSRESDPNNNHHVRIARPIHGISHIIRSSFYMNIFINLLKFLKSGIIMGIQTKDVQMLTDIVMMHDIARMGEGKDEWELDSATVAFFYFTHRGYTIAEAKLMAEAIANKDSDEIYYSLTIKNDDVSWAEYQAPKQGLVINLPTLLMNIVDCADVIRARLNFDADLFKFYQIAAEDNETALAYMGKVLREIKCLVFDQGAYCYLINNDVLAAYEGPECYRKTKALIDSGRYPLLKKLYNNGELFNADNLLEDLLLLPDFESLVNQARKIFPDLTTNECSFGELLLAVLSRYEKSRAGDTLTAETHELINQLIRLHIETNDYPILLRGITKADSYETKLDDQGQPRTKAAMELKKTSRNWLEYFLKQEVYCNNNNNNDNANISTKTERKKISEFINAQHQVAKNTNKIGNPKRSCIAWLPGMQQFTNAAYAIISPKWKRVGLLSSVNKVTGMGKKHEADLPDLQLSKQNKINKFQMLREITWKGGVTFSTNDRTHSHTNEILYQVTEYNMIVFTNDPCPATRLNSVNKSYYKPHSLLAELEALFLQYEYQKVYRKRLPLVSRSAMSDQHQFIGYFNEQEILMKWRAIIADFLLSQFVKGAFDLGRNLSSLNILKGISNWRFDDIDKVSSLMSNYPLHLQESIKLIAKEEIDKFIQYLIKKSNRLILAREFVNNFYKFLLAADFSELSPDVIADIESHVVQQFENFDVEDALESEPFDKSYYNSCHSLFYKFEKLDEVSEETHFTRSPTVNCLLQSKVFSLAFLHKRLHLSGDKHLEFKEKVFYELEKKLQEELIKHYPERYLSDEQGESIAGYLVFLTYYCKSFGLLANNAIRQRFTSAVHDSMVFFFNHMNNFKGSFNHFMPPFNFMHTMYDLSFLSRNTQRLYLKNLDLLKPLYKSYIESDELLEITGLFKFFQENLDEVGHDSTLINFIASMIKPGNIADLLTNFFKHHPGFLTYQEINIKILETITSYCEVGLCSGETVDEVKEELSGLLQIFESLVCPNASFSLKSRYYIQKQLNTLSFPCAVDEVLPDQSYKIRFLAKDKQETSQDSNELNNNNPDRKSASV